MNVPAAGKTNTVQYRSNRTNSDSRETGEAIRTISIKRVLSKLLLKSAGTAFLLVIPFWMLVRCSVYFYSTVGLPSGPAIGLSVIVTALVLVVYFWYARIRLGIRKLESFRAIRLSILVIFCFSTYLLVFISGSNVKISGLQGEYGELHPIVRLAVGTLILVDDNLIVTDMLRDPEDYAEMGLSGRRRSLHYRQPDGYAHAVDIRTIGHSWLRNSLLEKYFRIMGFNTLRHAGTADHLHVSLVNRLGS